MTEVGSYDMRFSVVSAVVSAVVSGVVRAVVLAAIFPVLTFTSLGTAHAESKSDVLSIVVVGDVGLNRSGVDVDAAGQLEGGSVLSWDALTAEVAPLINGDLNMMNLETVVTDRNDLRVGNKGQKSPYVFRSHPAGVEKLIELGFNLISAANNHAYDYGEEGAKETVKHLQALTEAHPKAVYAGIGLNDVEAARPASLRVRGIKVAFSSIGIVTNMLKAHRAGPDKAGTLGFRYEEDWKRSVDGLAQSKADVKIMSVHYGVERDIRTDERQRNAWRFALDEGADMVVGHHAHVVRGIELHNGKPIFYGLGNFLIRGAANMGKDPVLRTCCDYGLMAKVHLTRDAEGFRVAAIEAIPMFDMHRIAHKLEPAAAGERIEVLNVLAEALDEPSTHSVGVRFAVRKDGTGLYCDKQRAAKGPAAIVALCADYSGPSPASEAVRARVRAAPDPNRPRAKKSGKGKRAGAARKKRR